MISVLLIDDDPDLLDIIRMELENETDFVLQTCDSPAEAIELARTGKFDSIVCDFTMPEMNGCSLLHLLRSQGCTAHFILYSGMDQDDKITRDLTNCAAVFLQREGNPAAEFRELKRLIRTAASKTQKPLLN
ncbi:MAG: response regulator [Methanoregula sp.]|nr:response regulator [Methanoregula sp.]